MILGGMTMELTQLKQFKAVARKNSVSLAAKELHISQPALSTAIKNWNRSLTCPYLTMPAIRSS